ncbi:hypothetical protein PLESTB_000376900 [Pleodorina starrii]|uniref:ribose-5-phosphate isomerase n=1 Tax=Pleodorina starrii TaxID=330485 RepID=A0A9W6EZL5_9CHLO|nr:hypothetical protein PLESTM_000018000 [Pleodorina starrii]GLC50415.1 hypothetical protein PLESTB_000376900 [Pleodorina starrii]GLC64204.1 hypothetical protein PLESTF_000135800 [Pleodorina starrii]
MLTTRLPQHRLQAAARNQWRQRRVTAVVRCSQETAVAESKRAAARACVDRFVRDGALIGLGPGEMTSLVIEEVGRRLANGKLMGVVGVPVCDVAAHEAAFQGVPLVPDARAAQASVVVADADQIDLAANAALVGCASEPQQPDIPRLRAVLTHGSEGGGPQLVLLTESSRVVGRLGGTLPVWLDADSWEEHAEELDDTFLGDAELWRRSFSGQSENPRGGDHPYISPQGHTIVDVRFYEGLKLYGEEEPYDKIAEEIEQVAGVVAHGLLIARAAAAVVARPGDEGPQIVEF